MATRRFVVSRAEAGQAVAELLRSHFRLSEAEVRRLIRERRVRQMRGSARSYAGLEDVYEELDQAEAIHRKLGCPVIEVSTLAIEETAHRIIRLVEGRLQESHKRRPRARARA